MQVVINCNEWFVIQRLTKPAVDIPLTFRDEVKESFSLKRCKSLHSLVPCINDIDSSIPVNRDSDRLVELTRIKACASKLRDEIPVRIKHDDAFVAGIRDVDSPFGIHCQSARPVEGLRCFTLTENSPGCDEFTG